MNKLVVLTFSDKPLDNENHLKKSCESLGLDLNVIIHSPWEFNAIKIKLLFEWLPTIDPNTLVLVVDALDVIIYDSEEIIIEKYHKIAGDIIFSAESNFYFRNKKLLSKYWKSYPRQKTIYDYLNSGTYMGSAVDLLKMIERMVENEDISLTEESLRVTRSDQYAFSKHYVDQYNGDNKPKVRLDHYQKLMGCSGGRFAVIPFPDISKTQAFVFFLIERNILKFLKLHQYQNKSKDFILKSGRLYNKKTEQFPSIIHLPGTWNNFNFMINNFLNQTHQPIKRPDLLIISTLSYLISVFCSLFLLLIEKINQQS